jgi:hypothetical protein
MIWKSASQSIGKPASKKKILFFQFAKAFEVTWPFPPQNISGITKIFDNILDGVHVQYFEIPHTFHN